MWEIEYATTDKVMVTVLVGVGSRDEAIRLVKESDILFDRLVYARNQLGIVWQIGRSDRK